MDQRSLIGRDQDLAIVDSFLGAREDFALLVIEDEAGIGKTTLWERAIDDALARGMRVLTARPGEAESSLSYAGAHILIDGAHPKGIMDT